MAYPGVVSWEDRARLERDPSAPETEGKGRGGGKAILSVEVMVKTSTNRRFMKLGGPAGGGA